VTEKKLTVFGLNLNIFEAKVESAATSVAAKAAEAAKAVSSAPMSTSNHCSWLVSAGPFNLLNCFSRLEKVFQEIGVEDVAKWCNKVGQQLFSKPVMVSFDIRIGHEGVSFDTLSITVGDIQLSYLSQNINPYSPPELHFTATLLEAFEIINYESFNSMKNSPLIKKLQDLKVSFTCNPIDLDIQNIKLSIHSKIIKITLKNGIWNGSLQCTLSDIRDMVKLLVDLQQNKENTDFIEGIKLWTEDSSFISKFINSLSLELQVEIDQSGTVKILEISVTGNDIPLFGFEKSLLKASLKLEYKSTNDPLLSNVSFLSIVIEVNSERLITGNENVYLESSDLLDYLGCSLVQHQTLKAFFNIVKVQPKEFIFVIAPNESASVTVSAKVKVSNSDWTFDAFYQMHSKIGILIMTSELGLKLSELVGMVSEDLKKMLEKFGLEICLKNIMLLYGKESNPDWDHLQIEAFSTEAKDLLSSISKNKKREILTPCATFGVELSILPR
jgi:hypothetical protein